ncbi:SusC/RagA family TonB-linked outer membrane protein [Sunxiuqinia sp. sy24]|uniref:SusC/RagA family TonB-linked outer membrane protein n=1 Tax=Sunxiuqinia sp. sy24 TaxID=3461495 RepID=UPI00404607AA
MKLTSFILLITFVHVSASVYSQQPKLNVSCKNGTVREVLRDLEDQSGYFFMYRNEEIDTDRKVNIEIQEQSIEEVLSQLFNNANVSYEIHNRQIILMNKDRLTQSNLIEVSGKVTDQSGQPIPGVSVIVKGATVGIITDFEGNFGLKIPANAEFLVFSFVGMQTQEIAIDGKTSFQIVLQEENINVDEVVVTALGLSREKKALGYAVQSVDGDEFVESKELNVVNALAGRISGVHITQGGGGLAGGGSRIVIRGETSLAGNNQPMFVIDGVPAGTNDIASEDIQSISVLKGPAAAALYGSRAGAGVILITTKDGPQNGRLNVEVNSSMSFQNPMVLPDVQDQYGQGSGGNYMSNRSGSWGPKFDGQNVEQLWGSNAWKSHPDNVTDFYETGIVATNNVSLAGDNETGMFRVSLTDIRQNGMIPNTEYRENRIDITSGWTFMDGLLNIKANVKYAKKNSDNDKGMDPRLWPTNLDLDVLKDYWIEEGVQQRQWLEQSNNPYFSLYENTNFWQNEKYIGNLTLDFKITRELSLMLRSGYNGYVNESRYKEQYTTEGANNEYGMFSTGMSKGFEMNSDFLLSYKKSFANNLSMVASLGGNMMETDGSYINGSSSQLLIPNVYNLANYRTYPTVGNGYDLHTKTNALYGFVNLGYKDMVYLDITARNDWNSTLKYKVNDSYFYPSASLSLLLNKMFNMNEKIDLLKLKMNYAGVGSATSAFQLDPFFSFTQGSGGVADIREGSVKNNSNLKPEYSNSFEFGAQTILFNNRLNVDLTYYSVKTKNQIWQMDVSPISGYDKVIRNIGEVGSEGLEVTINATPVKAGKFQWNTNINWSLDRTKVLELDEENPEYAITHSIDYRLFTYDYVGERRGAIYSRVARKFKYDPEVHDASLQQYNGQLFFDGSKDLPRSDKEIIGYYNPDWIGSWFNEFKYGNLSISALLFANVGNSVYNGFEKSMVSSGLDKRTVEGREGGVLPEGVWESPDGIRPFLPGDEVDPESYWGDFMTDGEINDIWIEDGSFLKLKEVSIGYSVPRKLINNTFFKDVKVSLTGRNLALWTKVKHVDPETFTNSSAGSIPGIVKVGGVPSARTFTLNLRLRF